MSTRDPRPGAKPNRLAGSTSPYLLQHRHNPVDWWPWGEEAFAEARKRGVPIFLSVGYSTCYWCHVMERESFESEAVAQQMNASFVCVKVDREERPDVDELYMAAVQAFTQRGGWPMSVFLEPATLRPFYAGTYFPVQAKYAGMPTFPQVLGAISEAWTEQRAECLKQAEQLADAVRERVAETLPPAKVGEAQVAQAVTQLVRLHDRAHGGFGGAPKFPQPAFLDLLLDTRTAAGDDATRAGLDTALRHTLRSMALGGVFDQVGGGFHRYSVDAKWLVPHFEKMLYDNGSLAATYARAAKAYADPLLARTARRTCEYVLREMTAPEGAFFSAQDAEVNHREGQNYLWTREQLVAVVGEEDGAWIAKVYGVDQGPNFQDPHHPGDPPANVLFFAADPDALLADPAQLARLDAVNAKLYAARQTRDQPGTDDKVLAAWNGLVIAGLSVAGAALGEPRFIAAARRAADFILARMRTPGRGLYRVSAKGVASVEAPLEDYAFLAQGLVELHTAGAGDGAYLTAAMDLVDRASERFGDGQGGLYDSLADRPDLFVRARSVFDGAIPSGASVMLNTLVDIALLTRDRAFAVRAAKLLASVSGHLAQAPLGAANSTRALLRLLTLDRLALDEALPATAVPPKRADDADFTPVEILCAVEGVEVGKDEPAGVILKVRVAEGYHLTAAEPGAGLVGLTPFRVHTVGGGGVQVYAAYPDGRELSGGPAVGTMKVYEGEFDLPVVLERSGEWKGTPLLAVTYQACTDTECLKPRTVELDLSIERA